MKKSVREIFGCNVFNDAVMKERLPKSAYKKMRAAIEAGAELDPDVADIVAHEMKEWAIEKGATHFTHWFQPLTGITAEKHDVSLRKNMMPLSIPSRMALLCCDFPERS